MVLEIYRQDALMEENTMAKLLKQLFGKKNSTHPKERGWADREEQRRFEQERESWKFRSIYP
jgi:hypothetical protein